MTFAVIVQARMTSTRLSGKVLKPIGDQSALALCLHRCARIPGVDHVVAAIPYEGEHDPLAQEVVGLGYTVVRGPQDDVLARYCMAAKAVQADVVMRVTSDCPFMDPDVCGKVVDLYHRTGVDYACNNMPARFPHGLDCDVFSVQRLFEAEWLASTAHDREHVTPWIRREEGYTRAALTGPAGGLERLRWTLDHPEDLDFFQAFADAFGPGLVEASWVELAQLCLRRPDLVARNAQWIDQSRLGVEPDDEDLVSTAPIPFQRAA